jgi:hypothetical protein
MRGDKTTRTVLAVALSAVCAWLIAMLRTSDTRLLGAAIAFSAVAFIGLYMSSAAFQAFGLLAINTVFVFAILGWGFSYSNIMHMIAFQVLCIFTFECMEFSSLAGKYKSPSYEAAAGIRKITSTFLLAAVSVSLLAAGMSLGLLYVCLSAVVFSPTVVTLAVFAVLIPVCILIVHLVRSD